MTVEAFESALSHLLSREPFRAFTVELQDGKRFEVDLPHSVVYRDGFAIFVGAHFALVEFDHKCVARFIDVPDSDTPEIVRCG